MTLPFAARTEQLLADAEADGSDRFMLADAWTIGFQACHLGHSVMANPFAQRDAPASHPQPEGGT